MGWTVIELNASDTRNAVAIRKAATQSSTHRSLFHDPSKPQQRTLILLDEVDHIGGGLRAVSEDRIRKGIEDDESVALSEILEERPNCFVFWKRRNSPSSLLATISWDSGGVLHQRGAIRKIVSPPSDNHHVDRVSDEALRRIARRVLREEDIDYTNDAIDVLVNGNHGDLRALVRDLQVLSSGGLRNSILNWFANTSQQGCVT